MSDKPSVEPVAYPVRKAAAAVGVTPGLLYQEIHAGRLKTYRRKERADQLILREDLIAWVKGEQAENAA